jgi:photosystem II stability/assembly factor-like uncharacterized protein
MTDPHDEVDTWLHAPIEPMGPPSGTFERIRKQARRRKARRAVMSAASAGAVAALIVVAVITLPRVVPSVLHPSPPKPASNATPTSTSSSKPRASASSSPSTQVTTTPASALPAVPANFAPTSITFIDLDTGWVIGQAGTAGHCATTYCTSMARTDNAGKSWYGLPAPGTGAPDGGTGVSEVRFLNGQDGWAFGPQLYATHDGGSTWTPVSLGGLRVTSLETVGSEAFAVVAQCTGSGSAFGTGCTRFYLYSSPADSNNWAPVTGLTAGFGPNPGTGLPGGALSGSAPGSATVVLTPTVGYLYTPSGALYSGPVTGTSAWTQVSASTLPCLPGAPQPDGQPSGGQLAAATATDLALACPDTGQVSGIGSAEQDAIYVSVNGGQSWTSQGAVSTGSAATSLSETTDGALVLGTGGGIYVSSDDGATWTQAEQDSSGIAYVGMTSPGQGVAVPADASQGAVLFTFDAGQSWQSSTISGG